MMRRRPAPGWSQAPGWGMPLDDPHPLPLRAAGSLGRWLWPLTAVGSFLVVVSYVVALDPPPHPGLSDRGLLTLALAAVVVVLLTIRRAAGPGPLARAVAEYAVVALVAVLLATGAGAAQQPADEAEPADTAARAGEGRPAVVQAAVGVRDWLADLWRRADQEADRRSRPPSTTTPTKGRAMARSSSLRATPPPTGRPL
jgi:hypothetical protein